MPLADRRRYDPPGLAALASEGHRTKAARHAYYVACCVKLDADCDEYAESAAINESSELPSELSAVVLVELADVVELVEAVELAELGGGPAGGPR